MVVALGLTTALAGCDTMPLSAETMTHDEMTADVARSFDATFSETPFVNGPIAVVTTENGELRSYRLIPCQDGRAICSGLVRGQAAQLQVTADHYIVSGLYGDRTFFLRPGGGGTMRRASGDVPLAWNSFVNGVARVAIPGVFPDGQFPRVRY